MREDRYEWDGLRTTSGFIAEGVCSDWRTVRLHHPHESTGWVRIGGEKDHTRITRLRMMGYKRQARGPPRVISAEVWSVKPLNLLLCPRDANDVEWVVRNQSWKRKPKRQPQTWKPPVNSRCPWSVCPELKTHCHPPHHHPSVPWTN